MNYIETGTYDSVDFLAERIGNNNADLTKAYEFLTKKVDEYQPMPGDEATIPLHEVVGERLSGAIPLFWKTSLIASTPSFAFISSENQSMCGILSRSNDNLQFRNWDHIDRVAASSDSYPSAAKRIVSLWLSESPGQ